MITYYDKRLYAYSFSGWERVESQILSVKTEAMAKFRLSFVGSVAECMCDKQDRILIPKDLRQDAQLTKDIVLVGNLDRFEIWDRERWDAANRRIVEELQNEEVREEIASLGL